MVSANNLKQYVADKKPDVSQMTLDIIEAIKTNQTVQFMYGGQDAIREAHPDKFFGDFELFGGNLTNWGNDDSYRKFRLDKIDEWLGIPIQYKVYVELNMSGYPTDKEVTEKLHELLDSAEPIMYRLKPQGL